jgi:endonuclease G
MAAKKRANKKSSTRKRTLPKALLTLVLCIAALSATYHFGSFKLRAQMERAAIKSINAVRSQGWVPRPIVRLLNLGYDTIPESQGLVVEGGELGYEDSPLIAGIPQSEFPVRVLHNQSYITLFNEKDRHPVCIAFKASKRDQQHATIPSAFFEDPRIRQLRVQDLRIGPWTPHTIAPASALARRLGEVGANEACLVTNLAPMSEAFSTGLWQQLIHEITVTYPQRFGDIWIYLGPAQQEHRSKFNPGVPVPACFYAIVFDLTEAGGLRAIAFLVPQNAQQTALCNYITSISKIEKLTGLQFLPAVDYHTRDVLSTAVSPQLW